MGAPLEPRVLPERGHPGFQGRGAPLGQTAGFTNGVGWLGLALVNRNPGRRVEPRASLSEGRRRRRWRRCRPRLRHLGTTWNVLEQ